MSAERLVLVQNRNGEPKSHPGNERWLAARLGTGPLSWAFRRGGQVVRVASVGEDGYVDPEDKDDDNGPATIGVVSGRELSTRLSDHYDIVIKRERDSGAVFYTPEWFPIVDAARALETVDRLPLLRPLRGVMHTPLLRATGGLITEPGYDVDSRFLYLPDVAVPPVPTEPTRDQVMTAIGVIRKIIAEFPWVGEHSEANYLGGLFTPLLRLATPPPYKLLAIGAKEAGSGKSYLAALYRIVHGGTMRSWPGNDEELGKQILSVLAMTTGPVCQIDNIRGVVLSAKLEALLTTRELSDRLLGSSNNTTVINDRLWVATGNSMTLAGDLHRRSVGVLIDPGRENPEDRLASSYAISDFLGYVRAHRAEILHHLLVVLAGWDAADRPVATDVTADDFGPWVAALRGILTFAEVPGRFDHKESRIKSNDPAMEDVGGFLAALHRAFGDHPFTAHDVAVAVHAARRPYGGPDDRRDPNDPKLSEGQREAVRLHQTLKAGHEAQAAMGAELSDTFPAGTPKRRAPHHLAEVSELRQWLGYWFRGKEAYVEGYRLAPVKRERTGRSRWMVELSERRKAEAAAGDEDEDR